MLRTGCSASARLPQPGALPVDFADRRVLDAWQIAWSQLRCCGQPEGLAVLLPNGGRTARPSLQTELLAPSARSALPRLVRGTRELDVAAALAAAIPLIGAGPGLTPSWDDLLIGYMCGLRAAVCAPSQERFLRRFGQAVYDASSGTTAVSRSYIERTVEGFGPAWVEAVLAAIAAGDPALTNKMAERALRVGHTSGIDMMLGAVLGRSAWQTGRPVAEVLAALSCH